MKIHLLILAILYSLSLNSQDLWHPLSSNPVELGGVSWLRDYDEAIQQAQRTDRPILIFFQEVPGCSTCITYGKEVMSNPLIIETIEQYFIPVCIYNNRKGSDAKVLKIFKEPSWNNPVVRIVDRNGKDIVDRLASSYSKGYLVEGMVSALRQMGKPIPEYLSLLELEYSNYDPQELVLGMYCFWSGEKLMARIPGVTTTEAGFMNGKEVVKVTYNPNYISDENIVTKSKNANCADVIFDNSRKFKNVSSKNKGKFRKDKESKYYLYKSPYKALPMTGLQQLKANAEIAEGGDITYLLSPRQIDLWKHIKAQKIKTNLIGIEISQSWISMLKELGTNH